MEDSWKACGYAPFLQQDILTLVRLQGPAGTLTGPLLAIAKPEGQRAIKIFYEDKPLLNLGEFDDACEELAIQMFVDVAKAMSEEEAAHGQMTMEQARAFAATAIGSLMPARLRGEGEWASTTK